MAIDRCNSSGRAWRLCSKALSNQPKRKIKPPQNGRLRTLRHRRFVFSRPGLAFTAPVVLFGTKPEIVKSPQNFTTNGHDFVPIHEKGACCSRLAPQCLHSPGNRHLHRNEKRSAGTCWVSGVKFNHGSTSSRWRRLLAVETLAIDLWHDSTTGEDLRPIDRDRGETLPANRSCKPHVLLIDRTRQRTALHALHLTRTREQRTMPNGLVMTGHNNARSSKDRSRKKAVMAAI